MEQLRPTKKQRELLVFIEQFIAEHGYSPSYREIMTGLNYTSVATVALHVNSLIKRGHLLRRDGKARSLELAQPTGAVTPVVVNTSASGDKPTQETWLVEKVEHFFAELEAAAEIAQTKLDQLYVLCGALKVLGLDAAAAEFMPRLTELRTRATAAVMEPTDLEA